MQHRGALNNFLANDLGYVVIATSYPHVYQLSSRLNLTACATTFAYCCREWRGSR